MFKSTKGSVTFMAYASMLFFAVYMVILCGNGVRKYKIQAESIKIISDTYDPNVPDDELLKIYFDNGGELIEVD